MRQLPILVVGSAGRVGRALFAALPERSFRRFDLPDHDARNYESVAAAVEGCEQIVHLAWNLRAENFDNTGRDPANVAMAENVLRAAGAGTARRVVLASSVHAGEPPVRRWPNRLVHPGECEPPVSPYGESKLRIEGLGRDAAAAGLDVIAIRFGGVGWPRPERAEWRRNWLHSVDFARLMAMALDAAFVPGRFTVCYGVSRSRHRRVSLRNELGWRPLSMPSRVQSHYPPASTADARAAG
jgi:hypothetical protein